MREEEARAAAARAAQPSVTDAKTAAPASSRASGWARVAAGPTASRGTSPLPATLQVCITLGCHALLNEPPTSPSRVLSSTPELALLPGTASLKGSCNSHLQLLLCQADVPPVAVPYIEAEFTWHIPCL